MFQDKKLNNFSNSTSFSHTGFSAAYKMRKLIQMMSTENIKLLNIKRLTRVFFGQTDIYTEHTTQFERPQLQIGGMEIFKILNNGGGEKIYILMGKA